MIHVRVGAFDLYPTERRLMVGERAVELGGRAFDLLLALVEQPGRLVHKNTLMQRVWPKLVVDENNLAAQVASLRRALGAGAIRTVPGHGYRLELEVRTSETPTPVDLPPAEEPVRLVVPRRGWLNRLTPLIGRQPDVTAVRDLLVGEVLITVVGGPGIGKTRLAQEVLSLESTESSRPAAWVSLQPISDIQHVAPAIAVALGIALPEGEGFESLGRALQDDALLLALDGAEHLTETLPGALGRLLSNARGLRLLVTSQLPLGVSGERVHRLSMLSVPRTEGAPDAIREFASVQLFCDRVSAADAAFRLTTANCAQVAEICRRLDGNALALELAAARAPALGIGTLLERMDSRLLKRLGAGEDPRHSTLHAALDWSYNLLTDAEKRVFETLAVFPGTFSIDVAARCVADDATDVADAIDLIARLVDRSLLTTSSGEPPRYTLLETARQFALGKLTGSGALERARQRFATTLLIHMDAAYLDYWSLDEAIWLSRYEPDLANVRSALDWASQSDAALGVALYGSVWPLYVETDLETEGRLRFEQVVVRLTDQLPSTRVARFWEAVATYESGYHFERARFAAELAAKFHERAGTARARYYAQMLLALNWRGDAAAAQKAYDEAVALEDPAWPVRLLALGAKTEGALAVGRGQFAEARSAYARAVRHALAASEHEALAATLYVVELDIASGDIQGALQLARPLVQSLRHSGRRDTAFDLMSLAFTALVLNHELAEARALASEIVRLAERTDAGKLRLILDAMAYLACLEGQAQIAAQLLIAAEQARSQYGELGAGPAAATVRQRVLERIEEQLGGGWRQLECNRARHDAATSCKLALGLFA
jgi:predicted ATPase/DNA-binding winged helix-turn-helix (wHTH) protein